MKEGDLFEERDTLFQHLNIFFEKATVLKMLEDRHGF